MLEQPLPESARGTLREYSVSFSGTTRFDATRGYIVSGVQTTTMGMTFVRAPGAPGAPAEQPVRMDTTTKSTVTLLAAAPARKPAPKPKGKR